MALSVSLVLSVLMLIAGVKNTGRLPGSSPGVVGRGRRRKRRQRTTVTLSIVTFLGYIVVMPWVGFILATLIYILAFALALGERRRWVLTVSPFLVTAVIIGYLRSSLRSHSRKGSECSPTSAAFSISPGGIPT